MCFWWGCFYFAAAGILRAMILALMSSATSPPPLLPPLASRGERKGEGQKGSIMNWVNEPGFGWWGGGGWGKGSLRIRPFPPLSLFLVSCFLHPSSLPNSCRCCWSNLIASEGFPLLEVSDVSDVTAPVSVSDLWLLWRRAEQSLNMINTDKNNIH